MTPRAAVRALLSCTAAALVVAAPGAVPAAAQASTPQVVPGMRYLADVWCGADGACLGVGYTPEDVGAVVVLRANGPSGPVRPVSGTFELHQIDCAPGGSCIAVGKGADGRGVVVEVSPDGTPAAVRPVVGATELLDVACPTATTCVATGHLSQTVSWFPYLVHWPVFTVVSDGQPTPARDLPRGTHRAIGIDCPSATRCLAVASTGFVVLTDADGAWAASLRRFSSTPGAGYPGEEISCPSSTRCYATAEGVASPAIMAVSAEGVAGPVQILANFSGLLFDIHCLSVRTCTVVGQTNSPAAGLIIDVVRGMPMLPTTWGNVNWFTGVSCVAHQSCGIVGYTAGAAFFVWHGPVPG